MRLESIRVHNFRRLIDVSIDLEPETTVFVGANNSGKTSAAHALQLLVNKRGQGVSVHDFNAGCWHRFREAASGAEKLPTELPVIELDLWFAVDDQDLHRVVDLLPDLNWAGHAVGVRISYEPRDVADTLATYAKRREMAADNDPSTSDLFEFFRTNLAAHYVARYYVIEKTGNTTEVVRSVVGDEHDGRRAVESLIRIDFLDAQRFLTDRDGTAATSDLSHSLSLFYKRNLQEFEEDGEVMSAIRGSEALFTEHLESVFGETLARLKTLGYPGVENPDLKVKSAFDVESVMARNTALEYALPQSDPAAQAMLLPERYNGLGFKNLIYMVIHVLDFHERWRAVTARRPPVHLVVIEEPEAHLHAQLQQVFIRQIHEIVDDGSGLSTQMLVSTHSAHIVNESEFGPVRYFRRVPTASGKHETTVLDVSTLTELASDETFLRRYLKLMHCDLFFADAVVLVEGNVERLLLRTMIDKVADNLSNKYLTVLEVGGAFAHKFKPLVTLLGIPTLVITDLDSVGPGAKEDVANDESGGTLRACPADTVGATTSNVTLKSWHPQLEAVSELLQLDRAGKVVPVTGEHAAPVFVAYQTTTTATYGGKEKRLTGRTLEEAFAFENLDWVMADDQRSLGLRPIKGGVDLADFDTLPRLIHERVKQQSFKKTEFALALMVAEQDWKVPTYIAEGLAWLAEVLEREPVLIEPASTPTSGPSS